MSLSVARTVDYVASYWARTLQCSQRYEHSLNSLIILFADNSNTFHDNGYSVERKPVGGQHVSGCGGNIESLLLHQVGDVFGIYAFHSRYLVESLFDADNIFICWLSRPVRPENLRPNGYLGILILVQDVDNQQLYGTFHSKSAHLLSHGIYHLRATLSTQKLPNQPSVSEQHAERLKLCTQRWHTLESKTDTHSTSWAVERVKVSRDGIRDEHVLNDRFVMDAQDSKYYFDMQHEQFCSVRHLVLDHKSHFVAIMTDQQNRNDFVLSLCYGSNGQMYGSMHTFNDKGHYAKMCMFSR